MFYTENHDDMKKSQRKNIKLFLKAGLALQLSCYAQLSFADSRFEFLPATEYLEVKAKDFSDPEFSKQSLSDEMLSATSGIGLESFFGEEKPLEELLKWSADPHRYISTSEVMPLQVASEESKKLEIKTLEIRIENHNVSFYPEKLFLDSVGQNVEVKITSDDPSVGVFVRDQNIVAWDNKKIRALTEGKTELLVTNASFFGALEIHVAADNVETLPRVKLTNPASHLQDLKIPEGLSTIDDLVQETVQKDDLAQISSSGDFKSASNSAKDLKIPKEITEVSETLTRKVNLSKKIEKSKVFDLTLRFVDERSLVALKQYFPAGKLRIHVQGTEYIGTANELGFVTIKDVPRHSHFFVTYDDPAGVYQAGVSEVSTSNIVSAEQTVFVRRVQNLDQIGQSLGLEKDASQASFCGQVLDGDEKSMPVKNMAVTIDSKHLGPFYVNSYGFFSKETYVTGDDGQFCFYKTDAGPVNINFFRGQEYVTSAIVHVAAGRHTEEKFFINDRAILQSNLVLAASAHDQLNNNFLISSKRTLVDGARVVSLGSSEDFVRMDEGLMESPRSTFRFKDATFTFTQSGEFEEMIFKQDPKNLPAEQVTLVYPKGFIEDMSVYAQSYQEQNLGSIVFEHGLLEGQGDQPIRTYLIDDQGKSFGEGWMYADGAVSKGMFFNVPFGHYTVMVYSQDGRWLASDTVPVYSGTGSYIRTGSREVISDQSRLQSQE